MEKENGDVERRASERFCDCRQSSQKTSIFSPAARKARASETAAALLAHQSLQRPRAGQR